MGRSASASASAIPLEYLNHQNSVKFLPEFRKKEKRKFKIAKIHEKLRNLRITVFTSCLLCEIQGIRVDV